MKAVIIEDEFAAAQNLRRLIKSVDAEIETLAVLQNVDESIEWFTTNDMPDVVFMDIHLADGDSFAIFDSVDIRSAVIFTTAFDSYALKAFEVNSIDYLLKPISRTSLRKALEKLRNFAPGHNRSDAVTQIIKSIRQAGRMHRQSFLIPIRDRLIPILSADIACVYSRNKRAEITCFNRHTYTMDSSLDDFLKQLDPDHFFRANRQFIISHRAVTDLSLWFDGKLAVNLSVPVPEKIIVSRARSADFKRWYMKAGE
ncbi:MAG: LytTR family DNA-binding domain-containing protein [Proteiniphilum sp.]|jgi:two-component system LytT family response regulator|nr:LytTR family DNA-binding domain-containing protein [Proteiniphilum sp.]